MSWFSRFERWVNALEPIIWGTHGGDWRSWINHTVIALAVCCPFGILRTFGGPDVVAYVATVMALLYVGREIVQVIRLGWKRLDTIMDCVGPVLVCVLAWTLGG